MTTWVELWAVARFDLGLSWDEFEELTPLLFNALCARRNIKFKHDRFANAQTAAAVYNVNRASSDSPTLTAFDFIRDEASAKTKAERQAIKQQITSVVGQMPCDTPREKFMEIRSKLIASLTAQGRTDAAELWRECWPTLVPAQE